MTVAINEAKASIDGTELTNPEVTYNIFDVGKAYRCKVAVCREDDGFSAHALNLPGVVSQGDTVEQALVSFAEALKGALAIYISEGEIPWEDVGPLDDVECESWILVEADV